MKKLMTMMGAVAMSFGLFADAEAWSSVKYDEALQDRTEGDTTIVGFDDAGTPTGAIHWWIDGFEAGTIAQPAVVSNDTVVGNYLKVETDKGSPMLRTLDDVTVGQDSAVYEPVGITDHGLFIDTKVRMTGTEDAPAIDAQNKNKLLVWLQTIDADETEGIEGSTNLMVTCGLVEKSGAITPVNYVLDADVNVGDWVQLTIRADKGTDNVPAFKIYVDGEQVTGDDGSAEGLAVFPSLVGGETTDVALAAAGFDGTGDINYVNLLNQDDAPAFAADATAVAITWGEHVASVKIGGTDLNPEVPYVVTKFGEDITATITYADGYRRASVTPTGFADGCFTEDIENNQFTFSVARYANASVAIAAELDADIATVTIDGEEVSKRFSSIAAIFDYMAGLEPAPEKATIALKDNLASQGFLTPELDTEITIDLKGFTLTGVANPEAAEDADYLVMNAGTMEIVDTVGGGAIVAGGCDGIIYNSPACALTLGATGIAYDGVILNDVMDYESMHFAGILNILDGKFKPSKVEGEGVTIPEGKTWSDTTDEDGFYTLVEAADYVAQIGANKYKTLAEAVAAVGANETIELLADCASVGIRVEGGKNFTIDFAGKKVTFNKPGAGSKNTQTQAFQLLEGSTIVFMNGTICCSAENKDATWVKTDTEKGIAMIIQNYANLTLKGMVIDAANIAHNGAATRYAMSNNSGAVTLEDTTITVLEGDIAFDTCKYKTYALPTIEVKGDSEINGDIELSGGNLTLTAGTLNGELVDAGIGNGVITKEDAFEADAPAGYVWKDGVLTKMAEPTATVKSIEEEDYAVAVQFDAGNIGAGYDNWIAKFVLISDVDIGAGEVMLGGSYAGWQSGTWVDKPYVCSKDEEISVLAAVGLEDDITVKTVFEDIQTFKCGVKNVALKNDATFTLKLVITDGVATKTLCTIDNLKVEAKAQDWPQPSDPTVIGKDAKTIFGDKVPEKLADVPASRFTKWASDANKGNLDFATCTAADVNIDAYLLDCAPAEVETTKAQVNIASIEFVEGKWVVTTVSGDVDKDAFGNGVLQLVDVTKDITGAEGSDAAKLWKMTLVPNTTPDNN